MRDAPVSELLPAGHLLFWNIGHTVGTLPPCHPTRTPHASSASNQVRKTAAHGASRNKTKPKNSEHVERDLRISSSQPQHELYDRASLETAALDQRETNLCTLRVIDVITSSKLLVLPVRSDRPRQPAQERPSKQSLFAHDRVCLEPIAISASPDHLEGRCHSRSVGPTSM